MRLWTPCSHINKKDVKPDPVARFTSEAPENCPVHRNEQRRSPTPNMYITPHYAKSSNGEDTPLATRHSLGRYITHPRGIHRCFVLMNISKLPDFRTSKPKRSKRLFIKIKVPALHPLVASAQELCKNRYFVLIIKAFSKENKKKPSVVGERLVFIFILNIFKKWMVFQI